MVDRDGAAMGRNELEGEQTVDEVLALGIDQLAEVLADLGERDQSNRV